MHAAVLSSSDAPPVYRDHPEPVATDDHEMVVEVLAAGLHHLTRAKANGSHYSVTGAFPRVPGADGVVRDPSGQLRYAVLDDTNAGTFADRTVIDARRSVVLPQDADPVLVAAAMNPGMSSWVALRRRIAFTPGQRVLIIGATGNAGRMAVQVAKLFGAARVIAAGRDAARLATLPALGADQTCTFDRIGEAADVDVVLDYVWGEPAATAMIPLLTARADRTAPLTWIQIGSTGGATAPVPSVALRSTRLQIVCSGIGSVPARDFIAELPELVAAVAAGRDRRTGPGGAAGRHRPGVDRRHRRPHRRSAVGVPIPDAPRHPPCVVISARNLRRDTRHDGSTHDCHHRCQLGHRARRRRAVRRPR